MHTKPSDSRLTFLISPNDPCPETNVSCGDDGVAINYSSYQSFQVLHTCPPQ